MSGEVTLEQVLALVPEEGHAIHIYDQEGNDYFAGTKTRSMKKSRCRTWYSRGFIAAQRI